MYTPDRTWVWKKKFCFWCNKKMNSFCYCCCCCSFLSTSNLNIICYGQCRFDCLNLGWHLLESERKSFFCGNFFASTSHMAFGSQMISGDYYFFLFSFFLSFSHRMRKTWKVIIGLDVFDYILSIFVFGINLCWAQDKGKDSFLACYLCYYRQS